MTQVFYFVGFFFEQDFELRSLTSEAKNFEPKMALGI